MLANQLYGLSAISLTYALSYYGLIPERVTTLTSITNKRRKFFQTLIGIFNYYYYLYLEKYAVGIELHSFIKQQSFLIASPEKSLCDQIYLFDKDYPLNNKKEMENYLFHNLRIDEKLLRKFSLKNLHEVITYYKDGP